MGRVFVLMCVRIRQRLYVSVVFPSANEAGETPLDIARRLKHLQCEELVSSRCLVSASACKHIVS